MNAFTDKLDAYIAANEHRRNDDGTLDVFVDELLGNDVDLPLCFTKNELEETEIALLETARSGDEGDYTIIDDDETYGIWLFNRWYGQTNSFVDEAGKRSEFPMFSAFRTRLVDEDDCKRRAGPDLMTFEHDMGGIDHAASARIGKSVAYGAFVCSTTTEFLSALGTSAATLAIVYEPRDNMTGIRAVGGIVALQVAFRKPGGALGTMDRVDETEYQRLRAEAHEKAARAKAEWVAQERQLPL